MCGYQTVSLDCGNCFPVAIQGTAASGPNLIDHFKNTSNFPVLVIQTFPWTTSSSGTPGPSEEAFTSLPVSPLFWVLTVGQCVAAEAPWGKFSGSSWRSLLPPPPPRLHVVSCRKKWKLLSHEGCVLLCVWDKVMSPAREGEGRGGGNKNNMWVKNRLQPQECICDHSWATKTKFSAEEVFRRCCWAECVHFSCP